MISESELHFDDGNPSRVRRLSMGKARLAVCLMYIQHWLSRRIAAEKIIGSVPNIINDSDASARHADLRCLLCTIWSAGKHTMSFDTRSRLASPRNHTSNYKGGPEPFNNLDVSRKHFVPTVNFVLTCLLPLLPLRCSYHPGSLHSLLFILGPNSAFAVLPTPPQCMENCYRLLVLAMVIYPDLLPAKVTARFRRQ